MVYVVGGEPQAPLGKEDRRAYQLQLKHLLAGAYPEKSHQSADRAWEHLQSRSKVDVDDQGRPVLQMEIDGNPVQVGDSAENVLNGSAPPQLVRQLLEARLQSELRNGSSHGLTEVEIARDWKLLQQAMPENDEHLTARSAQRPENVRGNRP